jgi:hypothetical protein
MYTLNYSANEMRKPTDSCLLCQEEEATQKHSHIVPKFFGEGIFSNVYPRHGISLHRSGSKQKIQDITKEDHLLCPKCEKGISLFETYCALRLRQIDNIQHFNSFSHNKIGEFEYVECKNIDIKIFNLFIYSIVWRASICERIEFNKFSISFQEEEKLRNLLKSFMFSNQNILEENLKSLIELPDHSHVIIKPKHKLRPPNSMLSAASLNSDIHQLFLVDYIIFYLTNKEQLVETFRLIDNNRLNTLVRFGESNTEEWKKYNIEMINKLIK